MISAIQRFALRRAILIVVAGSVPAFAQTPSPQLKPSATETRKSATMHVSGTAAKARRHQNVRTSGAVPKNVKQVSPPELTGTYYNCLELPQPEGCD
jgi:hypothetical protein